MKSIITVFLFALLICGCSKKQTEKIGQNDSFQDTQIILNEEPKEKAFCYVNSKEGLRIRNKPGTDGEKIGSLKNKEKIEIIEKDTNIVEIDGIKSNWIKICTEDNVTGYVFGGYLESTLEDIETIQFAEGNYIDETGKYNAVIKYLGNQEFNVSTNYPMFVSMGLEANVVKLQKIFSSELLRIDLDGRGGLYNPMAIKFNDDKQLVFQNDRYEELYNEDGTVEESEVHSTDILKKQ